MHVQLDEEPARVAVLLRAVMEQIGWQVAAGKLGLKITVRRTPTVAELDEAVRQFDLGTISLTPARAATARQRPEGQKMQSWP